MVLDSLRPSTSGGRHPAFVIRSFDNAKVRHFSFASKFCPSIWGDFQHEFDELERNVISRRRIRNFRVSKNTFRR